MSKVSPRFINDLENTVAKLFAPSIHDNQVITCYAGEDIEPYKIQADNIPNQNS